MKSRAVNFSFYVLIYFFLLFLYLLGGLSAAPPRSYKSAIFTYGIDSNIDIKGFTKAEVSDCVKTARENWEESGVVKFQFSKKPDVLITHYKFHKNINAIGFYDSKNKRILIEHDPERNYPHFKWTKKYLSHNITHEFGHFFGLIHTFERDSIMRPEISEVDKPSKNDFKRLKEILDK